ncbi:hypothetical protein PPERSA_11659 [Pseudocohnilembus persalinus]|uniref:Uncharacterized protein n=1 Tax=Pseudocohnilembus persalinus TaxID=266149 RepID=A0A0V0QA31_PSEPJ|nr:hypothetical protein PPERSA_11659 [Pseudocohnilembus persalinus]|eukprot:KRW99058.1 hypothetical protein PPERSA_11659 [Pseudocohnilembus persalinus]
MSVSRNKLVIFLFILVISSQLEIPQDIVNKYFNNLTKEKVKSPLFGIQNQNSPSQEIPLKFIDYNIQINDSIAEIEIKQVYQNNMENNIQTQYYFAISPTAVFTELEAKINGQILKGTIKEKKQAKQEYDDAIKQGKEAAYAEIVEEVHDIMKLQLGNLGPNQQIEITLKYIEPLEIEQNKLWKFQLGNTFSQRSINLPLNEVSQDFQNVCNPHTISEKDENAYKMSINLNINSSSPISFLESPSHEIQKNFDKNSENKKCTINFKNENEIPNKEFVLLYKNENFHTPSVLISKDSNKDSQFPFAAQLNFLPDFNSETSIPQAYNRFIKKFYQNLSQTTENKEDSVENLDEFDFTQSKTKGEYIFVVDRSGSMSGLPIEITKKALIQSIKLLNENHYFNVISFGSYFNSLFEESVQATEENKNKAIQQISSFSANYGGTNIFAPLQQVLTQKQLKNQQKSIFLISDGQDSQENQIIQSITTQVNLSNQRIYTLGIGNGVSKNLIKLAAQQGYGKFDFVFDLADEKGLKQKLLYLFKDSITPFLSDFKIEFFDKNNEQIKQQQGIDMLIPSLDSVQSIRKNEPFQLYFLFKQDTQINKIKFTCYDSQQDLKKTFDLEIGAKDLENPNFQYPIFQKIAFHKFIKQILNNAALKQKEEFQGISFLSEFKPNSVEEITDISIKYQILTDFTAFILVNDKNDNDTQNQNPELIQVPQIDPHGNFNLLQMNKGQQVHHEKVQRTMPQQGTNIKYKNSNNFNNNINDNNQQMRADSFTSDTIEMMAQSDDKYEMESEIQVQTESKAKEIAQRAWYY